MNSAIFTIAHIITRATVRGGDNYRATFAAALPMAREIANLIATARAAMVALENGATDRETAFFDAAFAMDSVARIARSVDTIRDAADDVAVTLGDDDADGAEMLAVFAWDCGFVDSAAPVRAAA